MNIDDINADVEYGPVTSFLPASGPKGNSHRARKRNSRRQSLARRERRVANVAQPHMHDWRVLRHVYA